MDSIDLDLHFCISPAVHRDLFENHVMMKTRFQSRNRWVLLIGFCVVVMAGLASRKYPSWIPEGLGKYPGDALWALMVFVGLAFIRPDASTRQLAWLSLVISFAVEFSQLYQASWLNAIRETTIGHLVLGSHFLWLDFVAYAIGVSSGVLLDLLRVSNGIIRRAPVIEN